MGVATFNGRHNKCKSLALLTLLQQAQREMPGLTLRQLARLSGVSYNYLNSRLGKWHKWKYINRRITTGDHGPCYCYSIAQRGVDFINYRIPENVLSIYIAELQARRQNLVIVHRQEVDDRQARITELRRQLNQRRIEQGLEPLFKTC